MGDVCRLLGVVEFASFNRLPVLTRLRTPPIDLVGARRAEDLHPCRSVGKVATQFLADMEIPGRVCVEAGEDGLLVTTCLAGCLEFDLRVAVLAEHPLERDMTKHLVPADGTPEELEQCLTVAVNDFQTHL